MLLAGCTFLCPVGGSNTLCSVRHSIRIRKDFPFFFSSTGLYKIVLITE
uniref:Uncharacterized protein n=1 Tax=Anguilla anguilla TaxID=7936 RepID=A0A0E9SK29_ANGAN